MERDHWKTRSAAAPATEVERVRAGADPWPAIETFDLDDVLIVRAELPGMKSEDVHVRVVGDMLVIEGERRFENADRRAARFRSEWNYGRFLREIRIPNDLDPTKLNAQLKDGVLELSLPYRESRRSREIRIEEGEASPTNH